MEQAEKKTAREFVKEKGINFMSPDFSIHDIIPLMEEYASQFKSPPVISVKEIEEAAAAYSKESNPEGRYFFNISVQDFTAGANWALSLSSEIAMEFANWIIQNGWKVRKAPDIWMKPSYENFLEVKSTSDLFQIFAKEKGYK